jgi:lipoprotein-anchoring transpeptidase ErfK/SrfK
MQKWIIVIGFLLIATVSAKSEPDNPDYTGMVSFLSEYLEIKYKGKTFNRYLYVAAKQQKMYLIDNGTVISEYAISSAKKGLGSKSGSHKTPTGLHSIKEKVGDDVPELGIIREKTYTGAIANVIPSKQHGNDDIITTRLFHLDGLEPGINKGGDVDSYSRAIMIHGTNEEGLIGTPASHGCVRMKNSDILHLYNLVQAGTYVVILNN